MNHKIFYLIILFSTATIAQKNNLMFKSSSYPINLDTNFPKTSETNKSSSYIQKIDSLYYWQEYLAPFLYLNHPIARGINYTYDANNNFIGYIYQSYNNATALYENSIKLISTYDAFNNQTNFLLQVWSIPLTAWVNNKQTQYSYDINNNRLSQLDQTWSSGAWLNQSFIPLLMMQITMY